MEKHGIKRAISFMLSLIMILSLCITVSPVEVKAAEGGTITVTASGVQDITKLKRGDTVTISVSISGNTKASTAAFAFCYDPDQLQLKSAEDKMDGIPGILSDMYEGNIGKIKQGIADRNDLPINGLAFTAVFTVKDTAKGAVSTGIEEIDFVYHLSGDDYPSVDCEVVNNVSAMNVVVPATGITLNKTSLDIAKGGTEQLSATLEPADSNSSVTWKSSNEGVATVSSDGEVTAVGKGRAVVTASADGKSASCTVNVSVPLEGIEITGKADNGTTSDTGLTIKKGMGASLSVAYRPDDAEHSTVTWESSDSTKVTVKSTGANTASVSALADTEGSPVTITAKAGNVTDTFTITVQEVKLTGIEIKNATTIHKGETETLAVTYTPEDTTDDKTVKWSTSDSGVATVNGSGKVTAVASGTANITASVGSHTATCAVTVDVPLKGIVPEKTSISLVKKQTQIIKYTLNPTDTTDNPAVTFSSNENSVASVNASTGEVTANAGGTATITLTGANGITAKVTVVVTEIPINSVIINKKNAVVEKGGSLDLVGEIGPSNTTDDDTTIKWKSSDETIATVSPATSNSGGTVTVTAANKGGTVTITATAGKNKTAVCTIMVPIHLEGITTPASVTMNRNETLPIKVTPVPENTTDDTTVTWTSSDETVASVNPSNGTVTALKEGKAVITAKTTAVTDGNGAPYESSTEVNVQEKHMDNTLGDTIEFTDFDAPLLKNQSMNMNSWLNLDKIKADNGITDDTVIEWSSSDELVAQIDQSGQVTGLKKGKTTITAVITALDGQGNETGKYTVSTEIEIKEIPLESIAFNKVITEMQVGAVETLGIIYNPENTTELKDVRWSSSDPSVLSVENGRLTALKAGTAEITAKAGDKSVTCKIEVKEVSTGGNIASGTSNGQNTKQGTSNGKNVRTGIRTGDTSNAALYIVLILASLAVILVLGTRKSRRVRR